MMDKRSCIGALIVFLLLASGCQEGGLEGSDGGNIGVGRSGSTARMVVAEDYLYAIVGKRQLQLFDISAPESPNPYVRVSIDYGIETLSVYQDYLLVGAQSGLHIIDNTDPSRPTYVSRFAHASAQDPVVAEDGHAYVTLRDGSRSMSYTNQMEVVNIEDITNAFLVDTIPMQRPYGLTIENQRLFVCDGVAGIKEFNTTDPANLELVSTIRGVNCNDTILEGDRLYVITSGSLLQYDVSGDSAVLLSELTSNSDNEESQ